MIITNQQITNQDIKGIYDYIEQSIDMGKCVELYMKDDSMLYIRKEATTIVYGYYPKYASHNNEEWSSSDLVTYPTIQSFEFVDETQGYKETREFDLIDLVKVYIGDEWSN